MIRFTEEEANTSDIARKVREQTSAIEDYILTDGKGNEIYDSEATRGMFRLRILYTIPSYTGCLFYIFVWSPDNF